MIKQISSLTLLTTILAITNSSISHALTFNLSGFSATDGTDTYTAEGSFEWSGGAGSSFSEGDSEIQNSFTIEVSGPGGYSFIFAPDNIDFTSSTINGTVNSNYSE